jgi:antitoxin component YwqK of YwqJK toxin-antitoxin module
LFLISVGIVLVGLVDSVSKLKSTLLENNLTSSSTEKNSNSITDRNGTNREYYPNGVLKHEGSYDESLNKKNGEWKYYSEDGNLKEISLYLFGKKWGESKRYSSEGNVNEVLDFSNGKLRKKEIISDGKIVRTLEFYENGEIKKDVKLQEGLIGPDGEMLFYHVTGQLYCEVNYDENGEEDGLWEFYDIKGQLCNKINYKNGVREGIHESYYENGKIRDFQIYKEGEREGVYESYNENGNLIVKCNFKEGEYDGLYECYYENGNLISKVNYKNGKYDGLYEYFYENGNFELKSNYKNGVKDGIEISYNEKGKIISMITNLNGKEISKKNQLSIWLMNLVKN